MTILLIILLILIIIYLIYQNKKLQGNSDPNSGNNFLTTSIVFDQDQENSEYLIAERDQAIRTKNEAEQEALAFSNLLKLKNQEVSQKDAEIARLKKEKSQSEIALNEKLKELKEKYSKQGKLLDEEQCENNKLVEKIEGLEAKIKELTKERQNLPGSFSEEGKDD